MKKLLIITAAIFFSVTAFSQSSLTVIDSSTIIKVVGLLPEGKYAYITGPAKDSNVFVVGTIPTPAPCPPPPPPRMATSIVIGKNGIITVTYNSGSPSQFVLVNPITVK